MIQEIAAYITRCPELNMKHIQTLFHITEQQQFVPMQYALLSIAQIFISICPLYKINEKELEERIEQRIWKDEKKQILYEQTFMMFYKKYLLQLNNMRSIKFEQFHKKNKKEKLSEKEKAMKTSIERTHVIVTRCYCELLIHMSHFNYFYILAEKVVLIMQQNDPATNLICMQTLEKIFKRNPAGQLKLLIQILKHYFTVLKKGKPNQLPQNFIKIIAYIKLKFYDTQQEIVDRALESVKKGKEKTKQKKERIKERKYYDPVDVTKLRNHVKEELKMAEATENKILSNKLQTNIMQLIFAIYFKVFKTVKLRRFFYDTINGILTYSHFLDVNVMKDLTMSLEICCDQLRNVNNMDNFHRRLMCIHTHYQLVNGPGTGIQIDESRSLANFYQCLLDLLKNRKIIQGKRQEEIYIMILQLISDFFLRKRQYSMEIVASFISISAQLIDKYGLKQKFYISLLFALKKLFTKYAKLQKMLDEENEGFGMDAFNIDENNPQTTNAVNSCVLQFLLPVQKKIQNKTTKAWILKCIIEQQPLNMELRGQLLLQFYKKFDKKQQRI